MPRAVPSGIVLCGQRLAKAALILGRKRCAELGMGDGDELAGAFAQGLAAQLRYAVFGDDIVDVAAAGRDRAARCDGRDDLGDRLVAGR